jgi:prevent-host-death family protein
MLVIVVIFGYNNIANRKEHERMVKAQVRPSRDLRNNYAEVMRVMEQYGQVLITHQGRGNAVLVDQDEFAKIQDLAHQQYIYSELQKSKALLDDPNVELIPHEEVMARLRERREARTRV